jgi:hypothetical protein
VTEADLPAANPVVLAELGATQTQVTLADAAADQQRDIALIIGRRQGRTMIAQAFQKLYQITDLLDLQNLKESRKYKGFRHIAEDGKVLTIRTWEEYCFHVEGKSVQSIDLELGNFKQLGHEFFDAMRQLGVGPGTMRDIRRLPEDEKQALLIAAETGDKDSFVELAESFIVKSEREKAELKKAADDARADYEALDKHMANTTRRADEAERNLAKAQKRIETETPDEYAQQVREEASLAAFEAEAAILGKLRPAFAALDTHARDNDCTHENFMSGLLAQIDGALLDLRNHHAIKLVPDADPRPDWTRDDFDAEAVVAAALAKGPAHV